MDADGNPQHPGDMAAQLELALDNLEAVLAGADMTFANIVRLSFYATDVDELLNSYRPLRDQSLYDTVLGIARLPGELLVMVEATAVD